MGSTFALWVYLSRTPLLWLTVTLLVYVIVDRVSAATNRHPLANPVLHSIWIIAGVLVLSGTSYRTYFDGAQFVHFALGPATVALAIPLYENRRIVLRALAPMALALLAGSVTALVSALAIARAFGMPTSILASLAPKSVTAGVAMGIAEGLGGDPSLTAVLVILTGILGAVIVTPLMDALKITDWRARGFAVGLASHGIGTARAFQVNPIAGTFAGIAMGLNALLTAILVPFAVSVLTR
ncbi:LrgB family protein [Microvirga massiliensis]|uniref:LrgB family protein n=1 Tax=Microvirga massiliensis TaxID=1033741 RepID=UPI00062BA1F3